MSFATTTTLVFFVCVFLIIVPMPANSFSDAEALLKLKKSLKNTAALSSWKAGTNPCDVRRQWAGVICIKNIVAGLRLGGMGLSGKIDVGALSQIPGLRTLYLIHNSFAGPIPEFNQIGALKALYISRNQFSGEIPSDLFANMGSLKKVWLSDNKFTGPIPSSLAGLPRILEIHLENNRFSGEIPEFEQRTLASLDLSNNNLRGEIPASLSSKFNDSSFKGNPGLCSIQILGKPCQEMVLSSRADDDTEGESRNNTISAKGTTVSDGRGGGSRNSKVSTNGTTAAAAIGDDSRARHASIGIMAASGFILLLMLIGIAVLKRRQERFESTMMLPEDPSVAGGEQSSRRSGSSVRAASRSGRGGRGSGMGELVMVNEEKGEFGLPDLMTAAAEVVVGNGTTGSSYKATMTNGTAVVVKRVKEMNRVGIEEFDEELRRLGGLRHKNIITPLAYYFRKEEKLLVYPFMPKGTLLYALHGDRGATHSELNWPNRLNIVSGIAQGLGFLHQELSSSQVPHGDLQSSNILLTEDLRPCLSDYGYVSLINPDHAAESLMAFRSPEALQCNQVSPRSDVYCLGIVILEVLTGKFPSEYLNNGNGGTDVVQWVRSAIAEGREAEVLDPEIAADSTDQMRRLLRAGAACAESNPDRRLDLGEAIRRIEEIRAGVGGTTPEARSIEVMPSLRDGYADQVGESRGVAAASDG